jgi:hypothetical protein
MNPLFLHLIARAIQAFVAVMHHQLNYYREEIRAQCLHPLLHVIFQLIISSIAFSFEVLLQWSSEQEVAKCKIWAV